MANAAGPAKAGPAIAGVCFFRRLGERSEPRRRPGGWFCFLRRFDERSEANRRPGGSFSFEVVL